MKKTPEKYFAIAAPGLEGVCAGELVALGMDGVRILPGGVEFFGDRRDLFEKVDEMRSQALGRNAGVFSQMRAQIFQREMLGGAGQATRNANAPHHQQRARG